MRFDPWIRRFEHFRIVGALLTCSGLVLTILGPFKFPLIFDFLRQLVEIEPQTPLIPIFDVQFDSSRRHCDRRASGNLNRATLWEYIVRGKRRVGEAGKFKSAV